MHVYALLIFRQVVAYQEMTHLFHQVYLFQSQSNFSRSYTDQTPKQKLKTSDAACLSMSHRYTFLSGIFVIGNSIQTINKSKYKTDGFSNFHSVHIRPPLDVILGNFTTVFIARIVRMLKQLRFNVSSTELLFSYMYHICWTFVQVIYRWIINITYISFVFLFSVVLCKGRKYLV